MPEYRVFDRELKRRYTIVANSTEEIDPDVYDIVDDEATSDHLGPLEPEYDVTKTGRATASPITDGQPVATKEK